MTKPADYKQLASEFDSLDLEEFASVIEDLAFSLLNGDVAESVQTYPLSEQLLCEAYDVLSQVEHKLRYLALINARERAGNL